MKKGYETKNSKWKMMIKAQMWLVIFDLHGKRLWVTVGAPTRQHAIEWAKDTVRAMLKMKSARPMSKMEVGEWPL